MLKFIDENFLGGLLTAPIRTMADYSPDAVITPRPGCDAPYFESCHDCWKQNTCVWGRIPDSYQPESDDSDDQSEPYVIPSAPKMSFIDEMKMLWGFLRS